MKMEVATAGEIAVPSIAQTARNPSGCTSATPTPRISTSAVSIHIAPPPEGMRPIKQMMQPSSRPIWGSNGRVALLRRVPAQSWIVLELKAHKVSSTVPMPMESVYFSSRTGRNPGRVPESISTMKCTAVSTAS